MQEAREPGFYWVRLKNEEVWRIGEYVSGVWSVPFRPLIQSAETSRGLPGTGLFQDAELAEIDPERILRGVTRLYPRT